MNKLTIYALCEPTDGEIRYVGVTSDVERRFKQHFKADGNTHRDNWIRKLKSSGTEPAFMELDYVDIEEAAEREMWWIYFLRDISGKKLTNMSDGGEGKGIGYPRNEHKPYRRGWRHTAEAKAKISAASKLRRMSPESRAKLSAAIMGHPVSKETIEKIRETKRRNFLAKKASLLASV